MISEVHLKLVSAFFFFFYQIIAHRKLSLFISSEKLSILKIFKFLYFPLPLFVLSQPLLETLIKDKS